LLPLYGVIVLGAFIFFMRWLFLGSLAKTQESIRPLVLLFTFPQLILSGIFFQYLRFQPLYNCSKQLATERYSINNENIANDGAELFALNLNSLGIIFWFFCSFYLATKFFVWQKVAS
jgi:hypothetical protein